MVNNSKPGSNEERIYKAFDEKIGNFDFEETPLRDVIQVIRDEHRIPVVIDNKALEAANLTPDMPISAKLTDMSLRSALKNLLGQVDLTYVVKDEVLKITTREQAEQELEVRVYPVADLVLPIDNGRRRGQQIATQLANVLDHSGTVLDAIPKKLAGRKLSAQNHGQATVPTHGHGYHSGSTVIDGKRTV